MCDIRCPSPCPEEKVTSLNTKHTACNVLAPLLRAMTASVLIITVLKYSPYFCLVSMNYGFGTYQMTLLIAACHQLRVRAAPRSLWLQTDGVNHLDWIAALVWFVPTSRLNLICCSCKGLAVAWKQKTKIFSGLCCNTKPNPSGSSWMPTTT